MQSQELLMSLTNTATDDMKASTVALAVAKEDRRRVLQRSKKCTEV